MLSASEQYWSTARGLKWWTILGVLRLRVQPRMMLRNSDRRNMGANSPFTFLDVAENHPDNPTEWFQSCVDPRDIRVIIQLDPGEPWRCSFDIVWREPAQAALYKLMFC